MSFFPLGYSSLNYWPEPLKKAAAKRIANDFVASCRSSEFADGLKGMSSLYNMSKWVQKGDRSACRNIGSERAPRQGHGSP